MNLERILSHLEIGREGPSVGYLSALLTAWNERIPWESASRIARHRTPAAPYQYARDAGQFFEDALTLGAGGTCFETNTALKGLLDALGFESTFAFCDMEDAKVSNPHCALIVSIDGGRYIADAGWPLPAAVPLADVSTTADVPVYRYHFEPVGEDRWRVTRASGDYEGYCFHLKGQPIPTDSFRARVVRDHQEDGLFLNNVIISRAMPGWILRFDQTKGLIERRHGKERGLPWTEAQAADIPAAVSDLFGIDVSIMRQALE